jgi:hypothetical protein
MSLPKLNQPLFQLEIPSTKQKISYRPFTVKEEKILLIAQESKDTDQIILAIKQILNNCIQDQINVDNLAIFDLEYILINIRAKSVNNMFTFKIKDPDTEEQIELEVDIADIEVQVPEDHTKKIQLDENTVLVMKYPSTGQLKQIMNISTNNENPEEIFNLMASCFDTLGIGEEIYKFVDYSKKEIEEFAESMSGKNIQDVKKFFETMPSMHYEKKYKNSKGDVKTFVVRGTETFFI